MINIKYITGFFASLKLTIWLLVLLIIFFLAGAFVMPARTEFQSIHSKPLFEWLWEQPLGVTWWLWISIVIVSVIVLNTLFCSIQSVISKQSSTQWLLLISPQVVHIGFLFIIFAHLLSAFGGQKEMMVAQEGSVLKISEEHALKIKDVRVRISSGHINYWEVAVEYYSDGRMLAEDLIRPNDPSVRLGLNIIVKDIRVYPSEAVLLQVNSEPGAVWALLGGIIFMTGITILLVLKVNRERDVIYS
jgi:hypothetical protein